MNDIVNSGIPLSVRLANWFYGGFYFACSFLAISYLGHAITSFNASLFGYTATFSLDGMETLKETGGWSATKIAFVYLSAPLTALLGSVVVLLGFRRLDKRSIHLRMFFFWFSFNCYLYYLSSVVSGIIVGYEFESKFFMGFVSFYAWLGWIENRALVVLILQLMISLCYAFLLIKPVYQLSFANRLLVSSRTLTTFSYLVLIPVLIGEALTLLATFPMDMKHIVLRLAICFVVLSVMLLFFNKFSTGNLKLVKGGVHSDYWKLVFGLMLLLFCVSRFLLSIRITIP